MAKPPVFDNEKIKELLPHRYPFLLVDKVIKLTPGPDSSSTKGAVAVAVKNVTANEEFFNGHFPGRPIMPGVLIIEAMAQTGGLACYKGEDSAHNLIIAAVKEAKFRKPVVPGDQLILTGEVVKDRGNIVVIKCRAHVDDELVSQAEIMAHVTYESETK